jgi:tight adherence protein C
MGGRIALAIATPLLVMLVPGLWGLHNLQLVALLLVTTGFGYLFPSYWVDRRRAHRQLAIEHGLPDALDLMVVCVQAGLGIVASLNRVVRDLARTHPILSAELELTIYEIRAGKSTTDGLRALAERTGVDELSTFVAMLVQTERFGTSVADTLRVHAEQGAPEDAVSDHTHLFRHARRLARTGGGKDPQFLRGTVAIEGDS